MARQPEQFRTIYCDPGEDFGWATGHDLTLLTRGTTKMWSAIDDIEDLVSNPSNPENMMNAAECARAGVSIEKYLKLPIGRIVTEDWRLYPWELKNMQWDPCRTARGIGAMEHIARRYGIPIVHQGADIKEGAQAAGAEELYDVPLTENRHQNDAIQHFVFWTTSELLGLSLPTKER